MKRVLLEVSLMNFILRISNEIKRKIESGVTRSIIDELHSWDIQRDQMEGESGVTPNIIDELHSSDIQGDQKENESGVTRSLIDELHSLDIQGDQMEGEKNALLEL